MPRARYKANEYEVVNFTDDAEWVLRDEHGDVIVFEENRRGDVEVQCERCGRWTASNVHAHTGRWICADRACYDAEEGGA